MTPTIFRRLILIWWGLPIVCIALIGAVERHLLPAELVSYLDSQASTETTVIGWILLAAGFVMGVVFIVASVGLYNFKAWGRSLFLLANIAALVLSIAYGPTVQSGIFSAVWYLDSILTGGIIFSMYLPPIGPLFDALPFMGTEEN